MNAEKLTPAEIESQLAYFSGTEEYHKFNMLFPNVVATDGAIWVAKTCEAFWLLEVIASHIKSIKDDWFESAKLTVKNGKAVFTMGNGNGNTLATQKIPFTDFPLSEITFFVEQSGNQWVILLPSEH